MNAKTLAAARQLYANLIEDLQDQLFKLRGGCRDGETLKETTELIRRNESALAHLIGLQSKLMGPAAKSGASLNLKAAREEVLGRLARLAA